MGTWDYAEEDSGQGQAEGPQCQVKLLSQGGEKHSMHSFTCAFLLCARHYSGAGVSNKTPRPGGARLSQGKADHAED